MKDAECQCSTEVDVPMHTMNYRDLVKTTDMQNHIFCTAEDTIISVLYFKMLSCLEHMYHDLGLVKDFNINPITLKRWLVRLYCKIIIPNVVFRSFLLTKTY